MDGVGVKLHIYKMLGIYEAWIMTLLVQGSIRMLWDQPISTFYAPTYHDIIQVSYCGWGYGSMMSTVGLVEGTFSPWLFRSPLCGHDACRPNSVCFIVVLNSLHLVPLLIDTPTGDAPPSHIDMALCWSSVLWTVRQTYMWLLQETSLGWH